MIFQISKIFGNNLIPPYFRIFGSKIGYRVREKVAGFCADFFENFLVTEGGGNMLNRPPGVSAPYFARIAQKTGAGEQIPIEPRKAPRTAHNEPESYN